MPGVVNWYTFYDWIVNDRSRCPQLFLYSSADTLIPVADIEEVVAARKRLGVDVKQVCWDDSPHVKLFVVHPEVYTKTCLDFAQACLASGPAYHTSRL